MTERYNLGDLIARDRDQTKTALIDLHTGPEGTSLSFADMDATARAVARGLARAGYKRGDRIAILSSNRAEFLHAYYGTMRAGLVSVPINHKFPDETVQFILRDAEIKMVFADAACAAHLPAGMACVNFDDPGPNSWKSFLDPGSFESARPHADEVAMFLYTSGSTGRPKGVPLTHAGHLWVVETRNKRPPEPDHRVLVAAPLYHMNGLAMSKVAQHAHLTEVLMPRFTAVGYIDAIERHGVTWLTSVPPMLAMMLQEKERLARADFSHVRIVRMGSAPPSPGLIDDLRRLFPNASVNNGYGTTEAGPAVFGPHPDGLTTPDQSVGYPLPGLGCRLVEDGAVDVDEGVLEMRNPAVMPGYHNLPEKTAEVLSGDGWYNSGDRFRRDENGFHYFVGRADDMFNCGGENVYPGEVEKILERHPEIHQACVVPVPDTIKGYKPVAFVVPAPNASPSEEAIKQFALANGPAYLHPRRVYVKADLPLTGTNKVDRKALTAEAQQDGAAAAE